HPVSAGEASVVRRRVSFALPPPKAVRCGPVNAVSAKPQILPGLGHPCNPGGAIEPDDPVFLNAKGCVSGTKCKEVSKSVFPEPKSSRPGGGAIGRQYGDEAVLLQAIDSLGSLDPEDAAAVLIRRQQAIAR